MTTPTHGGSWHHAEEEGNPQGYTYAPGHPYTYTRAEFSRALRESFAAGRAIERATARAARGSAGRPMSHDPNTCPACGNVGSIREIGRMTIMQPVTLAHDDDGELTAVEYEAWDWDGDSTTVKAYDCRECLAEWSDLAALADAMKTASAAAPA